MNLVVVESPAKAKTINKYLGKNYKVLASYGHVRDLPSKNGSVDPSNNFKMEWELDTFSKKYVKEITDAAVESDRIILATDPDREGEAIAWHVREILESKKLLKGKKVERVVFNEITKKAVTNVINKNEFNSKLFSNKEITKIINEETIDDKEEYFVINATKIHNKQKIKPKLKDNTKITPR